MADVGPARDIVVYTSPFCAPCEALKRYLAEHGVPSDTSCANFILARFSSEAEANACDDYLKTQGLIVRRVAGYKLPNCLRITVGDEASCRRVAHAVGEFKGGAR